MCRGLNKKERGAEGIPPGCCRCNAMLAMNEHTSVTSSSYRFCLLHGASVYSQPTDSSARNLFHQEDDTAASVFSSSTLPPSLSPAAAAVTPFNKSRCYHIDGGREADGGRRRDGQTRACNFPFKSPLRPSVGPSLRPPAIASSILDFCLSASELRLGPAGCMKRGKVCAGPLRIQIKSHGALPSKATWYNEANHSYVVSLLVVLMDQDQLEVNSHPVARGKEEYEALDAAARLLYHNVCPHLRIRFPLPVLHRRAETPPTAK